MQLDQTLIRGYIARTLSQKSDSKDLRLQKLEFRELAPGGADLKG